MLTQTTIKYVANIIGQSGIRSALNPNPIRYDSLREGLARVRLLALEHDASVHMPRIGAGLAGGDWQIISAIIEDELCSHGVDVTVYDRSEEHTSELSHVEISYAV